VNQDQPAIVVVAAGQGETIRPRRIRDLWAGTIHETGRCPHCQELWGNRHAEACKYAGIVGSNPEELYL